MTKAVTKQDSSVSEVRPAWVDEMEPEGLEGLQAQDLRLPLLKQCQALSPQRNRKDASYIPELEEGMFFHQSLLEILGLGPFHVTPVKIIKSRIRWVDPKKIGSGVSCYGVPLTPGTFNMSHNPEGIACQLNNGGACLHADWSDPNRCFLTYDVAVIVHERPTWGPVVMRFKSTGVRTFQDWHMLMKMRNAPIYSQVFTVESVDASTSGNDYKSCKIRNSGWVGETAGAQIKEIYDSLKSRVVTVADDSM